MQNEESAVSMSGGSYEIIQSRLNTQKQDLLTRLAALNTERKKVFGGVDFALIGNERISTDNACLVKDIYNLGELCIVGHNVHLGLRQGIKLEDTFSVYQFKDNRFEPTKDDFLRDETFLDEYSNLFKYYRNTFFVRFYFTENYLYFVFQLSDSPSDIKAFKWLKKDNTLTFVDARSAAEVQYPSQHEFNWTKATRDMQRSGKHPHVSLADKVFVEAIGGDITIKVEDNTDTGKGIYSEDVQHKDQNLDDAEIHFCDLNNLVLIKIKPYLETERYFVYNHKEKRVFRADAIKNACLLLPENQGIIFPNGFALQSGEFKILSTENKNVSYLKRLQGASGEDFMYVFYDDRKHESLLISYNIIKQSIETPIVCNGFTMFEDGKLCYIREDVEANKNHLVQIWQTPYSKQVLVSQTVKDNQLFKIGNKDLVRMMAESQALITLLSKEDSYSGLYNDIVKQCSNLLDGYYFLGEPAVQSVNIPILEIRQIAHVAINEFEKVVEIRKSTQAAVQTIQQRCEKLLQDTKRLNFPKLTDYIERLAEFRQLRGELIGAKSLRYVDVKLIETLEQSLGERAKELSDACVSFLLQDNALLPYQEKIDSLGQAIAGLEKAIDGKEIEKALDQLAIQLELLVDIVNNLKIEDTTVSTKIIENISVFFTRINQARIELQNKRKEISGKELSADFQAQIMLFEQSVINFLELSNSPERCDEFMTKLSLQLEEMETKFSDFDEFVQKIQEKREAIYEQFQAKRLALTESRNKRTSNLLQSAQRIIKSVQSKVEQFKTEVEINGYFAADLMIEKVRDIAQNLDELDDAAKSEEVLTLLKTAQQEAIRKLKDRQEIYVDGDKVIALGEHKFSVNKQNIDLTLVAKDQVMYYHITGTSYYEAVDEERLNALKGVWNQDYISENQEVSRFEHLAWQIYRQHQQVLSEAENKQHINEYVSKHYGEGLVKGVHDEDALLLLTKLQQLHNELGLLRFSAAERSMAQLFWYYLDEPSKALYNKQFSTISLLQQTFNELDSFEHLNEQLRVKIEAFAAGLSLLPVSAKAVALYLKAEQREAFTVSKEASVLYLAFVKTLKEKGKDIQFFNQVEALSPYPAECLDIVINALKSFIRTQKRGFESAYIQEAAVFLISRNYEKSQIKAVNHQVSLAGLKSLDNNSSYTLDFYEFNSRLRHFSQETIPQFKALQQLKMELVLQKKKALRLDTFQSQVLSSFVRNKLINDVYFPLIGANFAKQLGALGDNKRTDRMGLLLLVSPPGYGKTTLMEYLANRLGLIFMKINGPSIGHSIVSTDPSEAKNAGARQELEKLNLAFEMGDNIMLYLDDIQHCNPEFLQKFISLADGQRKIEGIYKGEAKTYDLRSKRFCLVMAGNPYTESGDKFQIPDMLANRADTYNLGEISGSKQDLFDLSLIENSLMSNTYLSRLVEPSTKNLYSLMAQLNNSQSELSMEGNFSGNELNEFMEVLKKTIQLRDTVLKVNDMYIKSAAMQDEYRNEPPFKLQGSYRDMNKLVSKIQPIQNEAEITEILLNHYQNESQTLTNGAEANLLKLKELMGMQNETEQARWAEIKHTFKQNKMLKGGSPDDRMAQVVALLAQFSDGLDGIKKALNR